MCNVKNATSGTMITRTLRSVSYCVNKNGSVILREQQRKFVTSSVVMSSVYQPPTPRTNYKLPPKAVENKLTFTEKVQEGYKILKEEIKLFVNETKEFLTTESVLLVQPNEVDVVWRFRDSPKSLEAWAVTCDSDHAYGFSTASVSLTPEGTALFTGYLNNRVPKEGRMKRTGYCNLLTRAKHRSFFRKGVLDWSNYTHLVMRVRGDGRCYNVNIGCKGEFDLTEFDMYSYVFHTRGGPYWQLVRLPFSKFVFNAKGRIQDSQVAMCLDEITEFGITLSDNKTGNFKLEIDYIGLEYDRTGYEERAYEMYRMDGMKF